MGKSIDWLIDLYELKHKFKTMVTRQLRWFKLTTYSLAIKT